MAFNKGDVVVLQTGKLKQFFRVQRDAGKDSTQVEDIFGVWAPAGGSVYVPTSKVKKVSPSDIRMRRVYVDVISPSVKDWQHRAEVARSIKRDIQGIGVMDFVPTREADLEFNCPTALAEDVKKMLHPTHFKVEVNSSKSTDKVVANSRVCNAITPADEKKMCDIMKRYLNKPGDKVVPKTHEGLSNGMSRTTIEVFAAYQDDQKETPDYRIKAAKKAVMDAMRVPCVGDGTRPMNDGSFSGHLVFMNEKSICSKDKIVANALEYADRTAKNGRVTEIDGVPYKPFKKGDKVVDRKGRKGTVTGFGIGGSRLNFVVRFATGEEEMFAGDMRHA